MSHLTQLAEATDENVGERQLHWSVAQFKASRLLVNHFKQLIMVRLCYGQE